MKKRFIWLTTGLVALAPLSTLAQVHMQWGAMGGLGMFNESIHYSDPNGAFDTVNEIRTGLTAGVVFDLCVLNFIAIEPGIVYSQRGGQFSVQETQVGGDQIVLTGNSILDKHKLDFLAIPIHARLLWPGLPIVKPYALAGMNLAFLLSAKEEFASASNDISSKIKSTALTLDFGVGCEFQLSVFSPFVEYVYNLGMTNLNKNPVGNASLKTSGSEIKAGFRFKL
jgi:hypothetical protein